MRVAVRVGLDLPVDLAVALERRLGVHLREVGVAQDFRGLDVRARLVLYGSYGKADVRVLELGIDDGNHIVHLHVVVGHGVRVVLGGLRDLAGRTGVRTERPSYQDPSFLGALSKAERTTWLGALVTGARSADAEPERSARATMVRAIAASTLVQLFDATLDAT